MPLFLCFSLTPLPPGEEGSRETRCKLVSPLRFLALPLASLLSRSSFLPRIRGTLLTRACTLSPFFPLVHLSRARSRMRRAERETNSKSAGGNRADWPRADHVGDPTDSRLCSPLAAFCTPVFAADYARARVHVCLLARSFARLLLSSSLSPIAPIAQTRHMRACVRVRVNLSYSHLCAWICRNLLGVFWNSTARSFHLTCI